MKVTLEVLLQFHYNVGITAFSSIVSGLDLHPEAEQIR